MAKYRKKPIVIDAHQWFKNGDHPLDYAHNIADTSNPEHIVIYTKEVRKGHGWEGEIVRYFRSPDIDGDSKCEHCDKAMHLHGWIDTLEGGHIVCPCDWIITGVEGEHYPCKPGIFAKTYEPVDGE